MRQPTILRSCMVLTACLLATGAAGAEVTIESEETLTVPAAGVEDISARTHNGSVTVRAGSQGNEISIIATQQVAGPDEATVRRLMDALEVTTQRSGSTLSVGRQLAIPKPDKYRFSVSFEITVPATIAVLVETHNGAVNVLGTGGDSRIATHNGPVKLETQAERIVVETHNGPINVTAAPSTVRLVSHNGPIKARFEGGNPTGRIESHNGPVMLTLNDNVSTTVDCQTHRGPIACRRPCDKLTQKDRALTARFGESDARLDVETHNGPITVR